jgi:hypothetical protein
MLVMPGTHASAIRFTSWVKLLLVICVEPIFCSAFAVTGECSSGL